MDEAVLSQRVLAAGLATGAQLRELLALRRAGDRRALGALLVDAGLVSPADQRAPYQRLHHRQHRHASQQDQPDRDRPPGAPAAWCSRASTRASGGRDT